jgi:hypothetical protein
MEKGASFDLGGENSMCNGIIWIIIAWLVLGNGNGFGGCGNATNDCGNTWNGCGCAREREHTCGCDTVESDCVRVVRNNGCGC